MMTVVRFNANELRADRMSEVIEWVRSLGVEPEDVLPIGVILGGESSYELHLSRFVRDEHGHMAIDQARDDIVTYPVVVDLGPERSWPAFLDELTPAADGR
jgi:hypothetical protein